MVMRHDWVVVRWDWHRLPCWAVVVIRIRIMVMDIREWRFYWSLGGWCRRCSSDWSSSSSRFGSGGLHWKRVVVRVVIIVIGVIIVVRVVGRYRRFCLGGFHCS